MDGIRMEEHFGFASDDRNEENGAGKSPGHRHYKKKLPKDQKEKTAVRKEIRKKKQERKKRIIIRNLSFKVNEKELMKVFSKYGDVVDVSIPKKPDGKMRGFAFIQYKEFQSAIEAVRNLNYKKLEGRPIAVDYAVAKDKYQHITSSKHVTSNPEKRLKDSNDSQIKEKKDEVEESDSEDDSKSDHEDESGDESVSDTDNDHVKKFLKEFDGDRESLQDEDEAEEKQSTTSHSSTESDGDDSKDFKRVESDDDDDDDDMEDDDTETSHSKRKKIPRTSSQEPPYKKKNLSCDVNEGKTIFIRNVSFDSSQDSLKTTVEAFGPVKYCLLCIDKFTELPRGTAFVKFENKEDADKLIEKSLDMDGEGIFLDGRKLSCTLALSRDDLQARNESGTKIGKDKRNLYLLKEGLIMQGSEEAQGVSQSDLATRSKLEILKRNKLKNFQFFVSDKRLCIHNIPSFYSDGKLRKLFKDAAGPGSKITEAKIMRNFKKMNPHGIAESKGFGFVAFEKHADALKALKEINNKPDIFTPQKRPIVEFAVENMNALLTKQRRQEKGRMKMKKESEKSEANYPEEEDLMSMKFNKKRNENKKSGKPEGVKRMHGNSNLANNSQSKKSKSKKKKNKLSVQRKPQFEAKGQYNSNQSPTKEKQQKKKKNKPQKKSKGSSQGTDSANFSETVNKYKQKLLSNM